MKNYFSLVKKLKSLSRKHNYIKLMKIGQSGKYPLYVVRLNGKGSKKVLLSAGVHGDEPVSPDSMRLFIENLSPFFLNEMDFTIFPCVNPYGYEHGTRENVQGVDINRSFADGSTAESAAFKKYLKGKRFGLFLDLHEDWEYHGFYLYEHGKKKYGEKIIKNVGKVCQINPCREIDGRPAKGGIIRLKKVPRSIGNKPLGRYIYKHHTNHAITAEAPGKAHTRERIKAHLVALKTALELFRKE